jgi:hypothetical protein
MGERRVACRVSLARPEGKRWLRRRRHRLGDKIKIDLQKMGWGGMDWIDLAQDSGRWRTFVIWTINLQIS